MTKQKHEDYGIATTLTSSNILMRHVDNRIIITELHLDLHLDIPGGVDKTKQVEAITRIKKWLDFYLNGCIAVNANNNSNKEWITGINNTIMFCPDDPTDLILQVLIHAKLNAIGEDVLHVESTHMSTDHSNGFGMSFEGNPDKLLPKQKKWMGERCYYPLPWWHRSDASMMDVPCGPDDDVEKKPKILIEWNEGTGNNTVSNDTQPAEIIKPKFKPKIIQND